LRNEEFDHISQPGSSAFSDAEPFNTSEILTRFSDATIVDSVITGLENETLKVDYESLRSEKFDHISQPESTTLFSDSYGRDVEAFNTSEILTRFSDATIVDSVITGLENEKRVEEPGNLTFNAVI
jgi:hypothetical protein